MPKKMRMAIGGPSDVETREEYTERRIADTERGNLNRMEKISPNPLYKDMRDKADSEKRKKQIEEYRKNRKTDPFENA